MSDGHKTLVVLFLTALFISACGFKLQNSRALPTSMQKTYLRSADTHSLFYRELRKALALNVELVERPADATAIVTIAHDETGQRVLSVSADNVPREFEVYYTVRLQMSQNKTQVLDTGLLTRVRDYTWSELQVLGKEREEAILRDALIADLVRVALRQLSSGDATSVPVTNQISQPHAD